uniref:Uncharacterized protein n=1 Tax=Oryza rufipogon TaxID=4529 RepID=A0A0E0NJT0_ORYRU
MGAPRASSVPIAVGCLSRSPPAGRPGHRRPSVQGSAGRLSGGLPACQPSIQGQRRRPSVQGTTTSPSTVHPGCPDATCAVTHSLQGKPPDQRMGGKEMAIFGGNRTWSSD